MAKYQMNDKDITSTLARARGEMATRMGRRGVAVTCTTTCKSQEMQEMDAGLRQAGEEGEGGGGEGLGDRGGAGEGVRGGSCYRSGLKWFLYWMGECRDESYQLLCIG